MYAAKIYAENYANAKKSQVDTTWRSHPSTANSTYQQLSDAAHLLATRVPPAPRPHTARAQPAPTSQRITVDGLYCTPTENLSRFCKIFAIFRINCFPVWNN